jgi:hypothetical protein
MMLLTVEIDEDGTIIVSDNVAYRYGAGDTLVQALNAYIESFTTYCEMLEEGISDEYPENEAYLNYIKGQQS